MAVDLKPDRERHRGDRGTTLDCGELPGETSTRDDLIDSVVADLNALYTATALKTAYRVGNYLLDVFFAGRIEVFWRRSRRHLSFRKLAQRSDLRFSYTFLWTSIAITQQLRELPADVGWKLSLAHHRLLLSIKDPSLKLRLAEVTLKNNMSTRCLGTRIGDYRRRSEIETPKRGRPRTPEVIRSLGRLLKATEPLLSLKSSALALESTTAEKATSLLDQVEEELHVLCDAIPTIRERLAESEATEESDTTRAR
jgi:hypothetical protein